MARQTSSSTISAPRLDEHEREKIRTALAHYGAYLKATRRDSRPYDELSARLSGEG